MGHTGSSLRHWELGSDFTSFRLSSLVYTDDNTDPTSGNIFKLLLSVPSEQALPRAPGICDAPKSPLRGECSMDSLVRRLRLREASVTHGS